MVIYEVSLVINEEIYPQFQSWLKEHVKKMLEFPGFMKASILTPENENMTGQKKLTVQYQIENRAFLTMYLSQSSVNMREEARAKFGEDFSAERRIFETLPPIDSAGDTFCPHDG